MKRRSFLGAIGAAVAAFFAPVSRADVIPATIDELVRMTEALFADVDHTKKAYVEEMNLSRPNVVYRVVPEVIQFRKQGTGLGVERALIAAMWKDFEAVARHPVFRGGTLIWRVMPNISEARGFGESVAWTRIRARFGVLPDEKNWAAVAPAVYRDVVI